MGKFSDIFICFKKKSQPNDRRISRTQAQTQAQTQAPAATQQRSVQNFRAVESAPNRSRPPALGIVNNQPQPQPQQQPIQQIPRSSNEIKIKIAQVKVTSTFNTANLEVRDFRPEKKELPKFKYVCPICYRYFNHILQTSCCRHYICKYCVDDMNHTATEKKQETISCHFCKKTELAVTDVTLDATIRKYTDSAVMSPTGTLTGNYKSGLSEKNSPSKFSKSFKQNSKEAEKMKGATFQGFSNKNAFTDLPLQGDNNQTFSNTADLAILAKNNKMKRSYISEGEMAKSFEIALGGDRQGGDRHSGDRQGDDEEEKIYGNPIRISDQPYSSRGLQNFSGVQDLASSQHSNNQERAISEDSINDRHGVSVISEKASEEMTVSTDLRKDRELQNQLSRSNRFAVYAEGDQRIENELRRV